MDIGDILVTRKGAVNPYLGSLNGPERSQVLGRFLRGFSCPEYEFWFAPSSGGACRISREEAAVDPEAVNFCWDENGVARRRT